MEHTEGATDTELFEAIGEFVVAFSHLVSILEYLTASLIAVGGNEESYKRARIAVSGLTAQPLSNAFFSVVAQFQTAEWSKIDRSILKECRKELEGLISRRNRISHDVWNLDHPNFPRPSLDAWYRTRTLGTPIEGHDVRHESITIEEIKLLTEETRHLNSIVRIISLVGIAGNAYRPEIKLKLQKTQSGHRLVQLNDG